MSAHGSGPLRPSLHRGNMSTNSVPILERSNAKLILSTKSQSNPSNATLMSSPPYHHKSITASEMIRGESADTHRSLRTKLSRKDLKEMQRSATPMEKTSSSTTSSKHKYSRSWEDDSNDDDARSISSFSCPFASEFDSKHRDRAEYGEEETTSRQRFLDAVFRKLSQKTGLAQRESRAWAAMNKTIIEEHNGREKTSSTKATKSKPHFLDLSGYISPIPVGGGGDSSSPSIANNVTPRPSDFQRFETHTFQEEKMQSTERPQLRSRRSADTLGESRRLQREEWSAVALNSYRGAATAESVGSSLGLSVGQICPPGMSHAMLARATGYTPVPSLPDWARNNNRSLYPHLDGSARSIDMVRAGSHDASRFTSSRPVDMGRAASHDASIYLNKPVRPAAASRGVSGPIRGSSPLEEAHHIPSSLQSRSQAKSPRSQPLPLSPLSPQWPRSAPLPVEDCYSPTTVTSPAHLHRGSTSSAASDSGASSCYSSVPQTPVSRSNALPPHSIQYGVDDDEIEMTADDEDNLLSGAGPYALDVNKRDGTYQYMRPAPLLTMTPKSNIKKGPHVASIFYHGNATTTTPIRSSNSINKDTVYPSSSFSSSSTNVTAINDTGNEEEEEGTSTVKANRIQRRPRASTTSSVQSPTKSNSPASLDGHHHPISPSRSSSLQKNKNGTIRDSISSCLSSSTTSSTSHSSHSESLLSYTKGSPTSSCASPVNGSPSSMARHHSSSPRKRNQFKAEDWASSIGRRFAKGALKGSPNVSAPQHLAGMFGSGEA